MERNLSITDIFSAMTANQTIAAAKTEKDPKKLWKEFWLENEVCCLFADANVGKSILAVQIGNHIGENVLKDSETVLYYDFELSKKQFELRYSDDANGTFNFSDRFIRVELDNDAIRDYCKNSRKAFDDVIMEAIEANIAKYNSRVLIVDNLSWLVNMKDTPLTAGKLMQKLCEIKKKYKVSVLVLSHTPKRNLGSPITQNSLSGSKKLPNFFDSMFAVGMSLKDPSLRYVKQIKVRTGKFKYDASHVMVCKIEKDGPFLGFFKVGYSTEEEQLRPSKKCDTTKANNATSSRGRKRKSKIRFKSELTNFQLDMIEKMVNESFKNI